ncbi:thiamine phosphate synthase [Zhouia spongiae]|uniref:Thiamine-phosphate synthase n=1 Tax=Zhouia spongiae TaxID=2202721 RepID=A0ABY3YQ05_9FLAO|nr:thiamine phosphate synthase [Zhouia spongiae]UNY99922.1 thiamine phosphate synthase [Zhouia spongiae]
MKEISKLQYISQGNTPAEHLLNIREVCKAGVDWVQLRLKNVSDEMYAETAVLAKKICDPYGAKLIINDNVKVAKVIRADGVHLGKTDMSPQDAREILGAELIIGGTANTLSDCIKLCGMGVDYIGLGPFRFTTTKQNLSPVLGLGGYRKIVSQLNDGEMSFPVIAIGGIQEADVKDILYTGVYGVAVSGALTVENKISQTVEKFQSQLWSGRADSRVLI